MFADIINSLSSAFLLITVVGIISLFITAVVYIIKDSLKVFDYCDDQSNCDDEENDQ